jgi:hypothetical protein
MKLKWARKLCLNDVLNNYTMHDCTREAKNFHILPLTSKYKNIKIVNTLAGVHRGENN